MKIPAFTIIELCVVMLLSAIVTGIGFFTLDIFQGSMRKFKKDAGSVTDITLLHRLIESDFWNSKDVVCIANGFKTNSKNGTSIYTYTPDYITREQSGLTDTFYFQNEKFVRYFQKNDIDVPGLVIDAIGFNLIHKKEIHQFEFAKVYGADILIANDPITIK